MSVVPAIRAAALRPQVGALREAVVGAKGGDQTEWPAICGALMWAGFASPHGLDAVYDTIADAWLSADPVDLAGAGTIDGPEALPGDAFWDALTDGVADAREGFDATTITARTVMIGTHVDAGFAALTLDRAEAHTGAAGATTAEVPGFISLDELAAQPEHSLARDLHRMWVENNFDPEVLDRDALRLDELPPALRWLNTRILQMHDVWHLMAGYETTAIGEVAISAFQLAQFGHGYSAMFLPFALAIAVEQSPEGAGVMMQFVVEAWRHGRTTPPLMAIDWEANWHRSIEHNREAFGIGAFASTYPQNIIEMMSS